MDCPKCRKVVSDEQSVQCPHCGIFFAKYAKYHANQNQPYQPPASLHVYQDDEASFLAALLFEDALQDNRVYFIGRIIIFIGLLIWSVQLMTASIASNAVGESFLHAINLPFHEAGHVFFRPFGQFITSLGGTLGQLLMPLICLFSLLLKNRDPFGAAVAFWWFGENFLDIAPYMNDARAGDLPLVGGNFGHSSPYGFHDWEYLLTETHLIQYDNTLAKIIFVIGCLLMLSSLLWAGWLIIKQYQYNSEF